MTRSTCLLLVITAFAAVTLYSTHANLAQTKPAVGTSKASTPAPAKMTSAQKIANAMSAAPPEISMHAAIMDWPATPDGKPTQLRAGTNGWVCYPSTPEMHHGAAGEDPMCLDKSWQSWAEAWSSKTQPKITAAGIAYMLKGDAGASNTDPFAMAPSPTNQWVVSPPHTMVLFPDTKMLDAFPTGPTNGGPWVMWKGTPYAHLMVPVSSTKAATMSAK